MARKLDLTKNSGINLKLDDELDFKLKNYCINLGIERKDFIVGLIQDKLEGLILDNTEIELEEHLYFNMKTLKENGVVTATKNNPIHEREEIQIVKTVPNNLDSWNAKYRTFCSENKPSLHRGLIIKHEIDKDANSITEMLVDNIFVCSYDSQENTLEIVLANDIDMYFTTEQEQQKEAIKKENEELHNLFNQSTEENGYKYLKDVIIRIDKEKSFFYSFKAMKELIKASVDMYKEAGVLEEPSVKSFLEQYKEF